MAGLGAQPLLVIPLYRRVHFGHRPKLGWRFGRRVIVDIAGDPVRKIRHLMTAQRALSGSKYDAETVATFAQISGGSVTYRCVDRGLVAFAFTAPLSNDPGVGTA